jgi:LytR cell envelope-related transcriptional attenuator
MEQRWRTATIVISVVAAVELVGLAALGIALMGNPLSSHLVSRAAAAPAVRTSTPKPKASEARLARSQTSVIVLNGGAANGAAAAESARLRARGYLIGSVGNASRMDYTHTLVMYRPGYGSEGARLAHDLHIRIVSPLDGMRVTQLAGSHLVVVLGSS